MEKRVIAAIALSIAILFAFRYYEEKYLAPRARATKQSGSTNSGTAPSSNAGAGDKNIAPEMALPPLANEENVAPRKLTIENELYRAVLDNRGGVLTHWELKKYKSAAGKIFDMVPDAHMEKGAFPGSVIFDDAMITSTAGQNNYSVQIEGREDSGTLATPVTVVMRLRRGELQIEKRYEFANDNYVVRFSTKLQNGSRELRGRILIGQDIGPEYEHIAGSTPQLSAVCGLGDKVQREAAPKADGEMKTVSGDVRWVGLEMQYFVQAAAPERPIADFSLERMAVKTLDVKGQQITRDLLKLTVPEVSENSWKWYLGPKNQENLAAVPGVDMSGAIDYGTYLGFIVKPLLVALRFLNQFTHNYGWAIILLTFLLTIALFPFRLKQMVSMKKMQVLQPKIKEIQERYKKYKATDPKRSEMNQEVMALYREHSVNPLGGCLPLLLQMPFLFAFYRLLAASIELRHAPFLLWLGDLSAKDPYYILPIVMGVTMLISQKMTPMAPGSDPTQAKMMMIMPVVMTVFFLNVSSGLNLYFLCSNVFQIAFQKVAERWVGDKKPAPRAKSRA